VWRATPESAPEIGPSGRLLPRKLISCPATVSSTTGVYVDDGVSGATPLEERPEGHRLLQDAEAGAFPAVLIYWLGRLGRSLKTILAAHERLDRVGVALRSGTEPFDTASPIGKLLFSLLGSMTELERATIAERTTRGRDRVAREGRYTGGVIPVGYDLSEGRQLIPSSRIVPGLGITEAEVATTHDRRGRQSTDLATCPRRPSIAALTTARRAPGGSRPRGPSQGTESGRHAAGRPCP